MTEIFMMPFTNGRIADVWGRRHLPSDETARHEPVLAIVDTHPRSRSLQAITGPDPGDDSGGYPSSLVIEMPLAAAPPRIGLDHGRRTRNRRASPGLAARRGGTQL